MAEKESERAYCAWCLRSHVIPVAEAGEVCPQSQGTDLMKALEESLKKAGGGA